MLTTEQMEKILNETAGAVNDIKAKLALGYPKEELEGIVRDIIAVQRKAAPVAPESNFALPEHLRTKSFNELTQLKAPKNIPILDEFQEKADNVYLLSKYLKKAPQELKSYQELQNVMKSMYNTAGQGAEWIPTGLSNQLYEKIRLEMKVAALFDEIPMPTNPYKPPVLTGDMTAYLIPEATSDEIATTATITASQVTTGAVTLTAKKLAARVRISDEETEDSIIPILPTLKNNIAIAVAYAKETAILNGDTAQNHQDSDTTGAKDARKAWDGLRKLLHANGKTDIGTFTTSALRTVRKKMGVFGVNPQKLAWVTGISGFIQMISTTEVLTVDKYGINASLLSGELGKFDGAPIVVSEAMRQDLNASGVYDGQTMTKTLILLVNHRAYLLGNRRDLVLASGVDIENGQQILVASIRAAFVNLYATTSIATSAGYNLTS